MHSHDRFIYEFNRLKVDGNPEMKDLLGGKGAGLAGMCTAGLPVPPGFTVSTEACTLFNQDQAAFDELIWPQVLQALQRLEEVSHREFGGTTDPLLVSVRSGAKFSMPGMMDTVLNIGLNEDIVGHLIDQQEEPEFVFDSYRRLLQMFGDVVLDVPKHHFEAVLGARRSRKQVTHDIELEAVELKEVCQEFVDIIQRSGGAFPKEPEQQLRLSVESVFSSWNNPRAITYRKLNEIPEHLGTAVNIQMMVFGNRGADSGSGVGFTRDPSTGENSLYGEFLPRSQGEEVVAGIRTPLGLKEMEHIFPEAYQQLKDIAVKLEESYRDMQDFEFSIERGQLYMLQTRVGKRTGLAAVRIACEMHQEDLINRQEALLRVEPEQLNQLLHPKFKEGEGEVLAEGLPASPGAAVGRIFSHRTTPSGMPRTARSFWCVPKPLRTIFMACTLPRVFLPHAEA